MFVFVFVFFFCCVFVFFFSSRRRHTRLVRDWSSDVCSSDLKLTDIFDKWGLHCTKIGEVTDSGMLEVYQGSKKVAEIPSEELVLGGGAPQYDMPVCEPEIGRASCRERV